MEGTLMSKNDEFEEVLRFWFSSLPTGDHAAMARQMEWWFRGADSEIIERFSPLFARAAKGANWTTGRKAHGRVLPLSSYSISSLAQSIAEPLKHSRKIPRRSGSHSKGSTSATTPRSRHLGRKRSSSCPSDISEELANLERAVNLAEELVKDARQEHRGMLELFANQARGHRDVIARFGRHPHRNELLG